MSTIVETIRQEIISGHVEKSIEAVKEALQGKIPPEEILNDGLLLAMERVGSLFQEGEIFIPDVFFSAKAMHESMDILRPLLSPSQSTGTGCVVIGTVLGDIHDIGKRLVGTMLEGGGFTVVDLGVEVSPDAFVKAVTEHQPQIVAMSSLITPAFHSMKRVVDLMKERNVREGRFVIIGGGPTSEAVRDHVGADAWTLNPVVGVNMCKEFLP